MQVHHECLQEEAVQALQRQVDELTAANLLLQDQLVRKEQFIAMIAHELRSPLSPIINYAQMLSRHVCVQQDDQQVGCNTSVQRQTNIIISQARRMTRLVNDLLDASLLSSGQFSLFRETCDIVVLTKEIVEQLRPVAPYHTFVVDVPATEIVGNWDAGRLQQALGNLLDNDIKYSDEGTPITLRVRKTAESVHVSVHNQGVSIPSGDSEMLFRPYTRLQSTSGMRHGSGLGLYITKSIIEAHQGTLRLDPLPDAADANTPQGTTFSFDLPLA